MKSIQSTRKGAENDSHEPIEAAAPDISAAEAPASNIETAQSNSQNISIEAGTEAETGGVESLTPPARGKSIEVDVAADSETLGVPERVSDVERP